MLLYANFVTRRRFNGISLNVRAAVIVLGIANIKYGLGIGMMTPDSKFTVVPNARG